MSVHRIWINTRLKFLFMQSSKTVDIYIVMLHLYIDSVLNYCLTLLHMCKLSLSREKILNLES